MHRLTGLGMVLLVWLLAACAGMPAGAASGGSPGRSTTIAVDPNSGLPAIGLDALPAEAAKTLALIATDGPFPYRQDGAVFRNREGLLPQRPAGHYREYTVDTPGSIDRGARRIVAGADGERYYTDDHYASFRWIAP